MKEIKQHLEEAFQLVSSIPVKGDAVDVMAVVRSDIRAAYHRLEQKEAELAEDKEGAEDGEDVQ